MRLPTACCLLAALLASPSLPAANRSVYGPEAPGDAAFVRIVNAAPGPDMLVPELGATRFDPLAFGQVSPYRPVTPDIYQFSAGGVEQEVIAGSGRYYTLAVLPGAVVALEDPVHTDPARAQLFLYNLSPLPRVDLATADGKTVVIRGVPPRASGLAVVNAVAARLAVRSGGAEIRAIGDPGLSRGSSFSVFVLGAGSSMVVFTARAAVKVE